MARLANCLVTLRDQIDARWPNRSKSSDGWIGDEAHQATKSDHNPNGAGVVQAIDITHDPANGCDSYALAETLRLNRDPRIKYVISNGRIFSSLVEPWTWRPYTGANAHAQHVHVSADDNPVEYDNPSAWDIGGAPDRPGLHRGIVATYFGGPTDKSSGTVTAYSNLIAPNWWDRPGVALPARINDRPLPSVRVTYNGKSVICQVIDVGPWNTKDPYWITGARPQAESGFDMTGRKTNLAGIDLTPAAAQAIGLPGKGLVDWEFVTENDMTDSTTDQKLDGLRSDIQQMTAQITALLNAIKPPAITEKPAEKPAVVTPPATSTTPVLQQPGVGLGALGLLATGLLQAFGVVGPPAGETATTTGQVLPMLSAGIAALGATGMFGSWGTAISTVLSAFAQKPQTK